MTTETGEEVAVVLPDLHQVRMVWRQGLLADSDRPLDERLGLGVAAGVLVERGEAVDKRPTPMAMASASGFDTTPAASDFLNFRLYGQGLPLHFAKELAGACAPLREHADRLGEGDVDRVHPLRRQNVDAAGHGCRRRGNEDSVLAVLQLFDDERWD